jgi:hypothetical protein
MIEESGCRKMDIVGDFGVCEVIQRRDIVQEEERKIDESSKQAPICGTPLEKISDASEQPIHRLASSSDQVRPTK